MLNFILIEIDTAGVPEWEILEKWLEMLFYKSWKNWRRYEGGGVQYVMKTGRQIQKFYICMHYNIFYK